MRVMDGWTSKLGGRSAPPDNDGRHGNSWSQSFELPGQYGRVLSGPERCPAANAAAAVAAALCAVNAAKCPSAGRNTNRNISAIIVRERPVGRPVGRLGRLETFFL